MKQKIDVNELDFSIEEETQIIANYDGKCVIDMYVNEEQEVEIPAVDAHGKADPIKYKDISIEVETHPDYEVDMDELYSALTEFLSDEWDDEKIGKLSTIPVETNPSSWKD
jgi:hypothetical protein